MPSASEHVLTPGGIRRSSLRNVIADISEKWAIPIIILEQLISHCGEYFVTFWLSALFIFLSVTLTLILLLHNSLYSEIAFLIDICIRSWFSLVHKNPVQFNRCMLNGRNVFFNRRGWSFVSVSPLSYLSLSICGKFLKCFKIFLNSIINPNDCVCPGLKLGDKV